LNNAIDEAFGDFASLARNGTLKEFLVSPPEKIGTQPAAEWNKVFQSQPNFVIFPLVVKSKVEAIIKAK